MKKLTAAGIKNLVVKTLKDHKATNVIALNIKGLTDIADYMVIGTANSTTHVKTLVKKTQEQLAHTHITPLGVEGEDNREWMLLDFGDVVTHVMLESVREFYNLEKLWGFNQKTKKHSKIDTKTKS
jgi:ribosome-associated protein